MSPNQIRGVGDGQRTAASQASDGQVDGVEKAHISGGQVPSSQIIESAHFNSNVGGDAQKGSHPPSVEPSKT